MVREQLYDRGIRDKRVLRSMLRVPRHVFLGHDAGSEAYSDHSFPIGFAQTMSQPFTVANMAVKLELKGHERLLEIGTGSGYHAAVLANIVHEVYTVERVPALAEKARAVLADLLVNNVHVRSGDGSEGWIEHAPYDRIMLTAATRHMPRELLAQLADGGILVGPAERQDGSQQLVRLRRKGNQFEVERLEECSFVPMVRDMPPTVTALDPLHGEPHGR